MRFTFSPDQRSKMEAILRERIRNREEAYKRAIISRNEDNKLSQEYVQLLKRENEILVCGALNEVHFLFNPMVSKKRNLSPSAAVDVTKRLKHVQPWSFETITVTGAGLPLRVYAIIQGNRKDLVIMKKDILQFISDKIARNFIMDLSEDIRTAMYEWSSTIAKSNGGGQRKNACFVLLNKDLVTELQNFSLGLSLKLDALITSATAENTIKDGSQLTPNQGHSEKDRSVKLYSNLQIMNSVNNAILI